ncbi:MAG: DUF1592 domain-containing protein [Lentisphaeraceae bacterium]|nr:DUF1592 domain-containing protein [Lentisphaeraceae bacterium]
MIKILPIVLSMLIPVSLQAVEKPLEIDAKYRQFMTDYCIECHNAEKTKGKTRLDEAGFSFEINTIQDADKWQKILTAINAKEMPPEDETQPKSAEKVEFLEMLSGKMVEARDFFRDTGGKTLMRRLNRREYSNTMKDLLGVTVDVANLPADQSTIGYDTDGGSLYMSSDQIEQYLSIARKGLSRALAAKGKIDKKKIEPELKNKALADGARKYKDRYERGVAFDKSTDPNKNPKDFGLIDKRDALTAQRSFSKHYEPIVTYLNDPLSKSGFLVGTGRRTNELSFQLPSDGLYKVRARVGLTPSAVTERSFLDLTSFDKSLSSSKRLDSFHITKTVEDAQLIEAVIEADGKGTYAFRDKLSAAAVKNLQQTHRKQQGKSMQGSLWIDWMEWEGPYPYPKSDLLKRVSREVNAGVSEQTIKALIKDFGQQAFRGEPVSEEYLNGLLKVYRSELELTSSAQQSIIEPLAMILASPSFIYISEPSRDNKTSRLSSRELAVRLAYFLWSSPPDQELLKLAEEGRLDDEELLSKQVHRMLESPKSENFYRDFTHQWLDMKRLSFFEFNTELYPQFDNTMKAVAAEEVFQTVKTIVTENLSTANFLKSEFVVINGMLANHYDIPNVKGDHFRKVTLPKDSVRGGLTGMAAVLAMGSDGNKTSPVERGAWVLRKILNQPPPPAPANVPQLGRLEGQNLTAREILEAHQEEAQCAHCHKKIDPVGFGLENFDPTGKWRTSEPVHAVKIKKSSNGRVQLTAKQKKDLHKAKTIPIDASGQLYNGPAFKSYPDLQNIFLSRVSDFNRGLIGELLSYSLGRPVGFSDQEFIDQLQSHMKRNNNSMNSLIHEIVNSTAFKTKK